MILLPHLIANEPFSLIVTLFWQYAMLVKAEKSAVSLRSIIIIELMLTCPSLVIRLQLYPTTFKS